MDNNISSWKDKLIVEDFIRGKRGAIPFASAQLEIMLHLLKYNEKPIRNFMDLGAGDGIMSQLILEQYSDVEGCLVDFSEPMIEAAYKRLEKHLDRIKIVNCDISKPDWQNHIIKSIDQTVDAAVSGYAIHHLPHGRKYELYQEIYNLLSPNGIFINVEHVASRSKWGEMLSDELFIDHLVAYEKKVESGKERDQVSRDFHNREDKKDNILLSAQTQCEWLREIGYQDVDIYFKSFELAIFAGKKL